MILLTQFQIWLDILLKVKFSLIDHSITDKFIHPLTCSHHYLVLWRVLSVKVSLELITQKSPTNFMHSTLSVKILKLWRQSLVRKPWQKMISCILSSWRNSKENSWDKDPMMLEIFSDHSIFVGISSDFSQTRCSRRSIRPTLINSTEERINLRDLRRRNTKKLRLDELILQKQIKEKLFILIKLSKSVKIKLFYPLHTIYITLILCCFLF